MPVSHKLFLSVLTLNVSRQTPTNGSCPMNIMHRHSPASYSCQNVLNLSVIQARENLEDEVAGKLRGEQIWAQISPPQPKVRPPEMKLDEGHLGMSDP